MTPQIKSRFRLKYILDLLIAIPAFLLLCPLFALIAIAIKLDDRGPVFFRQGRLGVNGKIFQVWKFRSMVTNADDLLDEQGRPKARSRITRVGALLRKTSLDELPQIINILLGEMSFVGPRAAIPTHLPRYTARQYERLRARPGITGLAQIKGRNTLRWSRRIRFDNWYIEHYSLGLDLYIAIGTVKVVLFGEGIVLDRNMDQVDDLAPEKA